MLTLVVEEKFNLLINENTGKWLCFKYKIKPQIIRNIKKDEFRRLFESYEECEEILDKFSELDNNLPLKNDLLTKSNYLVLHVSDLCNMNCVYCYAEDNIINKQSNCMDVVVMIDAIKKFYVPGESFYVLFHGREPLINYDNILHVLKYFKGNKDINFILQTNGILLSNEKIKELNEYNVTINVSIDGIDDDANKLRINGNDNLKYTERIKELLTSNKHIGTILIIHKNNINKLKEITRFLQQNGATGSSYNFLWPTNENPLLTENIVNCDELYMTMKDLFESSIKKEDYRYKFAFKERDLYLLYGRVVYRHINNYMCNRSPCGAGKNCFSVNHNGDVYACTTVNGQKENYLGNIYTNSKESILLHPYELKNRDIKKINDCSDCPYSIFCGGGGCAGLIYNYKKDVNLKSIYCNYYKNMIRFMIEYSLEYSQKRYFIN